jgi:hypothetical protein
MYGQSELFYGRNTVYKTTHITVYTLDIKETVDPFSKLGSREVYAMNEHAASIPHWSPAHMKMF